MPRDDNHRHTCRAGLRPRAPHFVQRKSKQEWLFLSKKVLIAHPPAGVLCIALRSAINEWPQTVWRPVEHCFGFVCQGFGLRIIRKLVGIVSWYFDYHAATLQKELWRSISLNCAIRNKRGTTGEGPREFLFVSLIVSSYFMYWVSVQKWTLRTIPKMGREKDVPIQSSRQRFRREW